VSGDWTVPTVNCASGQTLYSVAWVGIDGDSDSSPTVEQDGTASDCAGSVASYYAWYELYAQSGSPLNGGAEVELPNPVAAGDLMSASVSVVSGAWTLYIDDSTKGWTSTTHASWSAPVESSAEWIVERPEVCNGSGQDCSLTSLADFGTVSFTRAIATESGTSGSISDFSASSIEMLSNSGSTALAIPGPLDSTGEDFEDDWEATGP